jgi:hypothetical protein
LPYSNLPQYFTYLCLAIDEFLRNNGVQCSPLHSSHSDHADAPLSLFMSSQFFSLSACSDYQIKRIKITHNSAQITAAVSYPSATVIAYAVYNGEKNSIPRLLQKIRTMESIYASQTHRCPSRGAIK